MQRLVRIRKRSARSLALVFACLAVLPAARSEASLAVPPTEPIGSYPKILEYAQRELHRNVRENRGDDVPRYRFGRGRIAPYSISDAWCVAFATWAWNRAGFRDYLDTDLIWRSHNGMRVAIQVKDLSRWARRNGYLSTRAQPGYLVAYGRDHIGIVEEADRLGRAVLSIEGNKANGVREVVIDMDRVTGYISPEPLTRLELKRMADLPPDM